MRSTTRRSFAGGPAAGSGSTHQRGCMFGPCSAHVREEIGARAEVLHRLRELDDRAVRFARQQERFLPLRVARGRCSPGGSPRCANALERGGEVGHLEREVMRAGAVPRDEAGEEVVLLGRPRFEQLDAHAVAGRRRRPTPASGGSRSPAPPKMTVPPSAPVRKRSASEVSAAASATWSRSYRSTGSDQVVAATGAPRPALVKMPASTQPSAEDDETADRVEQVVVRR